METTYSWTIMKNNTVYEYVQGSSKTVKKVFERTAPQKSRLFISCIGF